MKIHLLQSCNSRTLLLMLLCLVCISALGQNAIDAPSMSKVLPPAPNAYELTKYSGLPVNLSSGSVSSTIPLGEIRHGKAVAPISLGYNSGNGVKVNEAASRTGMGWVLNAGGVITRAMSGSADESSVWVKAPSTLGSVSDSAYNYLNLIATGGTGYDSQPDVFSFNFAGNSGQFILEPTNRTKVVFLGPSALKVVTNFHNEHGGNWSLLIIDPNGIKYYFGGSTATEMSKTSPVGQACGKNFASYVPNAWYLKSIHTSTGEQISFGYVSCEFDYIVDVSQTMIRTPQATQYDYYNPAPNYVPVSCQLKSEDQVCASNLRNKGVILKSISSKLFRVNFSYASRSDIIGDSLLTGIQFYKRDNEGALLAAYKNFELTYAHSSNTVSVPPITSTAGLTTRPFLAKVSQLTSTGSHDHSMEYYNISQLPARLSFSQDYWGYYNGASNSSLIPKHTSAFIAPLFPNSMADRRPNSNYLAVGLLSKITYPTKGSDSLIYEANTVYDTRRELATSYTHYSVQGTGVTGEQNQSYPFYSDGQSISLQMSNVNDPAGTYTAHQNCFFRIYNSSNNLVYEYFLANGASNTANVVVSPGPHTLKITAYGYAAIGRVDMSHQQYTPFVSTNYNAGGVRLSQNVSDPVSGPKLRKMYVYAGLAEQGKSSGLLRQVPSPDDYYSDQRIFGGDENKQCLYLTGNSSPRIPLNYFSGSHILYRQVIELRDSLWTNGGVEHHFGFSRGSNASQMAGDYVTGVSLTNDGYDNGLETLKKTFITSGGGPGAYTTATVSETRTHYRNDERLYKEFSAYVVRKNWSASTISTPASASMLYPFDIARFSLVRKWVYPDTVTTIEYNIGGSDPITTQQVFLYNDTAHLQLSEQKSLMSDGRTDRIVNKYPREMVDGGSMIPYQAMLDSNLVTKAVVRSQFIDSQPIQEVKTNYAAWAGGTIFEPSTIQRRQGAGIADTLVRFRDFDADGNLLSQSQENGSPISYKYSYANSLLVAECKNALPDEFYSEDFEAVGFWDADPAHTGKGFHNGDFTIPWTVPNGRSYTVSYWYRDGGEWKYAVEPFTNAMTLSAGSGIDDISICPKDAEVTTYTHEVGAGISSRIDARGLTTYYEYDEYQRLKLIRDHRGDIVKTFCYNLAGENILCASIGSPPSTATAPLVYFNDCRPNPGTGLKSAGISIMKVKSSAGAVLYTFTEAELLAGSIYIAPGTYTFEYETYGNQWMPGNGPSNQGWGAIMTAYSDWSFWYTNHYSSSSNIHTVNNVAVDNTGYFIVIDIMEIIW